MLHAFIYISIIIGNFVWNIPQITQQSYNIQKEMSLSRQVKQLIKNKQQHSSTVSNYSARLPKNNAQRQKDLSKLETLISGRYSQKLVKNNKYYKQNIMNNSKSFAEIKAASVLLDLPELHSPQLTIQVSNILREKLCNLPSDVLQNISIPLIGDKASSKTTLPSIYSQNSTTFRSPQSSNYNKKSYNPVSLHRDKIIELQQWLRKKMQNPPINVQQSMQYRDIIMGIGMTHIIQLIGSRCREQGQMISAVWEITWSICRQIMIYLSKKLRKCQNILQDELEFYRTTYADKLSNLQGEIQKLKDQNRMVSENRNKLSKHLAKIKKTNKNLRFEMLQIEQMNKQLKSNFQTVLKQNLLMHMKQEPANQQRKKWIKRSYRSFIVCGDSKSRFSHNFVQKGKGNAKNNLFKDFANQLIKTQISEDNEYFYQEPDQYQLASNINSIRQEEARRQSQIDQQLLQINRTFDVEIQTIAPQYHTVQMNTFHHSIEQIQQQTEGPQLRESCINTTVTYSCQSTTKKRQQLKKNNKKLKTSKEVTQGGAGKKKYLEVYAKKAIPKTDKAVIIRSNQLTGSNDILMNDSHKQNNTANLVAEDAVEKTNNQSSIISIMQHDTNIVLLNNENIKNPQIIGNITQLDRGPKNIGNLVRQQKISYPSIYHKITEQQQECNGEQKISSENSKPPKKRTQNKILLCEQAIINTKKSTPKNRSYNNLLQKSLKHLEQPSNKSLYYNQSKSDKQEQQHELGNEQQLMALLYDKQQKINELQKQVAWLRKQCWDFEAANINQTNKNNICISHQNKFGQNKINGRISMQHTLQVTETDLIANKMQKNWRYTPKINSKNYSSNKNSMDSMNELTSKQMSSQDREYIQVINERLSAPTNNTNLYQPISFKNMPHKYQQSKNGLSCVSSHRNSVRFNNEQYQDSCYRYINIQKQISTYKSTMKPSSLNTGNLHLMDQYRDILKQTIFTNDDTTHNNNNNKPNMKHSQSCIQKNLLPIIRELLKQLQNAYKNNKLFQLQQQYQSLPVIISSKFNRMYGVRSVANKHMKDLLASLNSVRRVNPKYQVVSIFMIDAVSQNQNNNIDLFFVYMLIKLSIDSQFSQGKLLTEEEIILIQNVCNKHLTSDPLFVCKVQQLKKYLIEINDKSFASLYKGIINAYKQFYLQRVKSMDFIYRMLTWRSNLNWNTFIKFLSAFKKTAEWHESIITKMVTVTIDQKNTENIITYQAFTRFLLLCPQFSISEMSQDMAHILQLSAEQQQNMILSQQNQNSQKQVLIKLSSTDLFITNIVEFVFQTQILQDNQNSFIVKYCKKYVLEREVKRVIGLLNNGVLDERVRGLFVTDRDNTF